MRAEALDQQRLYPAFHFFLRLVVLSLPLYLTILLSLSLYPLQYATAAQSAWALRGLGYLVTQDGAELATALPGDQAAFHFFISEDSTAWKSFLFLFALLFAVPGIAWRKRLIGLAVGLPYLWLGNLSRVLAIVAVERSYGLQAALFTHDYLWRFGLISLVLAAWAVWLHWVLPRARTSRRKGE